MTDINIKVPVLDQAADLVKEFIQKLIGPGFDEVGGLLADQVRLWRFTNQIKIVSKAEEYLRKNNIKTKKVSLKVLAPLLDYCSLEEEETLRQKWIALLINTSREDGGINNVLFSYILSQLSSDDARVLDTINKNALHFSKSENAVMVINPHTIISVTQMKKDDPSTSVSIDNLIRLRLLKELGPSNADPLVMITDLGMMFALNCTLP